MAASNAILKVFAVVLILVLSSCGIYSFKDAVIPEM